MAAAVANGQRVVCVTATRGEAGVQDESRWPAEKLGEIRENELMEALKILGITEHHWLDYADGCCCDVPVDEGEDRLKQIIAQTKPDTILIFGPDGLTGHPDHQTVSCWVDCATKGTNISVYHCVEEEQSYEEFLKLADEQFDIYFNIDKPPVHHRDQCDIALDLGKDIVRQKLAAWRAMPSQTESMLKNTPPKHLVGMLRYECFIKA
jgi:LmbE family N-acetylglucosaminyl deacetylase